jgi:hypothetical protein
MADYGRVPIQVKLALLNLWPELEAIKGEQVDTITVFPHIASGPDISMSQKVSVSVFKRNQFSTAEDIRASFGCYNHRLNRQTYLVYEQHGLINTQIKPSDALLEFISSFYDYLRDPDFPQSQFGHVFEKFTAHEEAVLIEMRDNKCKSKSTVLRKQSPTKSSKISKKKV